MPRLHETLIAIAAAHPRAQRLVTPLERSDCPRSDGPGKRERWICVDNSSRSLLDAGVTQMVGSSAWMLHFATPVLNGQQP